MRNSDFERQVLTFVPFLALFLATTAVVVIVFPIEVTDIYFDLDIDEQSQPVDFAQSYDSLQGKGYLVRFANDRAFYREELEIIPENRTGLTISLAENQDFDQYLFGKNTRQANLFDFGSWDEQVSMISEEMERLLVILGLSLDVEETDYYDPPAMSLHTNLQLLFFLVLALTIQFGVMAFYKKGVLARRVYEFEPNAVVGTFMVAFGLAPTLYFGCVLAFGGLPIIFQTFCMTFSLSFLTVGMVLLWRSVGRPPDDFYKQKIWPG
jgi:hypothetical protein